MFFGGGEIPLGIDPDDEFYGIDWSKIDKPVKLTVTERVDIDNVILQELDHAAHCGCFVAAGPFAVLLPGLII